MARHEDYFIPGMVLRSELQSLQFLIFILLFLHNYVITIFFIYMVHSDQQQCLPVLAGPSSFWTRSRLRLKVIRRQVRFYFISFYFIFKIWIVFCFIDGASVTANAMEAAVLHFPLCSARWWWRELWHDTWVIGHIHHRTPPKQFVYCMHILTVYLF